MVNSGALAGIALLMASAIVLSVPSSGETQWVIGVTNLPPSFDNLAIDTDDDSRFTIDLTVDDINGVERIGEVAVVIIDESTVAAFYFSNYEKTENGTFDLSQKIPTFVETMGDCLKEEECTSEELDVSWTTGYKTLRLVFKFLPLKLTEIRITCTDTSNSTATYTGTFSSPSTDFGDLCAVPFFLSSVMFIAPVAVWVARRPHE